MADFDQLIKDKVDQAEYPYKHSAWKGFAKRAGIKDIILCKDNRKDIEEINEMYLKGLTFHYVNTIKDVLDIALLPEKVKDAIKL